MTVKEIYKFTDKVNTEVDEALTLVNSILAQDLNQELRDKFNLISRQKQPTRQLSMNTMPKKRSLQLAGSAQ